MTPGPQTGRGRNAKGARYENALVNWLREFRGFATERIRSGHSADPGDITWPSCEWHIDAKNRQRWSVLAWFTEAEDECPSHLLPALILKRPGSTDPGESLVVIRLRDWEIE